MNTAPWVWSAGGDVLNEAKTACVVTSPETVDAFQFLADLVHRHGVAPPPEALRAQGEVALFQTGRVAILQGHAANVADGRKVTGFDWDVAPLPRGKAGPVTGANGPAWIVPAAGQHHEEAWALVRFLTTPAAQTRIAWAGGGFGSKRVAEAVYRELPPPPKNARVFVDGMAYTRPDRFTANWPDLERAMNEELALLWAGRRPARETMAAIKARVDPLLRPPG
jgi:multiple sugar transport system substrate-binding protein